MADLSRAIAADPKFTRAYVNRGFVYLSKGDFDRAIADASQAISIDPKNASLYRSRGGMYETKGDFDRALADYGEAIRNNDKAAANYVDRGNAHKAKGDLAAAIADYDQAIALDPKYSTAWFERGIVGLYSGALPKALADFNQSTELNPKYVYGAIWLEIANKRSNVNSRLVGSRPADRHDQMARAVVRLFLGQLTPEALLAAADNPDPMTKTNQVCEANFYSGEVALSKGAKDDASRLVQAGRGRLSQKLYRVVGGRFRGEGAGQIAGRRRHR